MYSAAFATHIVNPREALKKMRLVKDELITAKWNIIATRQTHDDLTKNKTYWAL